MNKCDICVCCKVGCFYPISFTDSRAFISVLFSVIWYFELYSLGMRTCLYYTSSRTSLCLFFIHFNRQIFSLSLSDAYKWTEERQRQNDHSVIFSFLLKPYLCHLQQTSSDLWLKTKELMHSLKIHDEDRPARMWRGTSEHHSLQHKGNVLAWRNYLHVNNTAHCGISNTIQLTFHPWNSAQIYLRVRSGAQRQRRHCTDICYVSWRERELLDSRGLVWEESLASGWFFVQRFVSEDSSLKSKAVVHGRAEDLTQSGISDKSGQRVLLQKWMDLVLCLTPHLVLSLYYVRL